MEKGGTDVANSGSDFWIGRVLDQLIDQFQLLVHIVMCSGIINAVDQLPWKIRVPSMLLLQLLELDVGF